MASMAWLYLVLAGAMEMIWAVGLKYTQGLTRPVPTIITIAAIFLSLGLLALALKTLPVGTSYAVWTGIGTVGTAIFGMAMLNEPATPMRIACIGLIIAGIVGLKLAGTAG